MTILFLGERKDSLTKKSQFWKQAFLYKKILFSGVVPFFFANVVRGHNTVQNDGSSSPRSLVVLSLSQSSDIGHLLLALERADAAPSPVQAAARADARA